MIELFQEFPLPAIVLSLFIVFILVGWISREPARGLYLTFFSTSILLAPYLPVVRNKVTATEIIILLTWLAMLIHLGSGSIRSIPVSKNQKMSIFSAGVFMLWAFVSFVINNITFGIGFTDSLVEMINYFYGYLMFVTVVIVVDDWEKWLGCIYAWIAGAVVVSIFGVLVLIGYGPEWGYNDFSGRISSTLRLENQVPSFILPITLALVFMIVKRGATIGKRLFLFVTLIGALLTTIGTGSRIALFMVLAAFIGIIFLGLKQSRSGAFYVGMLVNLVLGLVAGLTIYISLVLITSEGPYALGVTPAWQRPVVMLYEWAEGKSSLDEARPEQLVLVKDNIADHIFVGTGPKLSGMMFSMAEIHNTYAAILFESGLLGLLLFLWWIWGVIRNGWLAGINNPVPFQRVLVLSMVVGMLLLLIYNMTMFGLRQRNIWLLAGLLIAATSVYKQQKKNDNLK